MLALSCLPWALLLCAVTSFCLPVSEGAACGQSPEDRAKTLAEMKLILQTVGFPWHIVALEEVSGPIPEKGPWRCLLGCPQGVHAQL